MARYNRIFKDFEDIKKEIDEAIGPVEPAVDVETVPLNDDQEDPLDHVKELLKEIEDHERVAVAQTLDSEELSSRLSLSTRLRMQEIVPGINVSESIAEVDSVDVERAPVKDKPRETQPTENNIEEKHVFKEEVDSTLSTAASKDPAVESRKKAQALFDQPADTEPKKKKRRRLVKRADLQVVAPEKNNPPTQPEAETDDRHLDQPVYTNPILASGVTTKTLEAEDTLNELDVLLEKLENKSFSNEPVATPGVATLETENFDSVASTDEGDFKEDSFEAGEKSRKPLLKNLWFWVVAVFILIVAVGILLTISFSRSNSLTTLFDDPPTYESSLIAPGPDSMNQPFDIAVVDGHSYVTDSKNQVIKVFDENGEYQEVIGEKSGVPFFNYPYGIAADKDGILYITDLNRGEILKYSTDGEFIGNFITNDVTLESPGAIRIVDDKLYVTDVTTSKAYVFSLKGELLQTIDGEYDGKELSTLQAIVADDQYIYLSDTGNARVLKLTLDGEYVSTIKNFSAETSHVNIRGLALDDDGNVYVADRQNNTVECFDQDGKLVSVLSNDTDENDLGNPNGLCIADGELYVTNILSNQVDVFALPE